MASPATHPEANEIRRRGRQRLIGAVTLVALLVVFVPMLLDSEPRPTRDQPALAIPPKNGVAPLPAPPAAPKPAATTSATTTPSTTPSAVAAKPQAPAAAVVEPRKPASQAATPAPASPSAPASPTVPAAPSAPAATQQATDPRLTGFAVQVGAFRDEAKLKQAREKLAAAGVVHYTERLDTKSGPLTRLRAGPFATREAAEGALVSIKRGALDGKVVPLP
jgi:DedD protein